MRVPIVLLFLLLQLPLCAQRQWGVNDSTSYAVGGDTVLHASRKQLYRTTAQGTFLLRDFTDAADPDRYIRDVDHWTSSDWYVLVGSRYIGAPTTLWRTTDAGANWHEDVTYLPAVEESSINQMTITVDGTAYLFNGYYESEVIRSADHGVTWTQWFESLIAHYYGILPCGSTAFIYGLEGDAFRPAMWQVPDTLWAESGIQFWSGCHNVVPWCHYAPFDVETVPGVVAHFEAVADSLCMTVAVSEGPVRNAPLQAVMGADGRSISLPGLDPRAVVSVLDAAGRPVRVQRQGDHLSIAHLAKGAYVVVATDERGTQQARFVRP